MLVSSLVIPSAAAADSVEVLLELVTPYAPVGSDTILFQGTYRNKTNSNLTKYIYKDGGFTALHFAVDILTQKGKACVKPQYTT